MTSIQLLAHWGMAVSLLIFVAALMLSVKKPEIIADDVSFASRMTGALAIISAIMFTISFWGGLIAYLPAVLRWLNG